MGHNLHNLTELIILNILQVVGWKSDKKWDSYDIFLIFAGQDMHENANYTKIELWYCKQYVLVHGEGQFGWERGIVN